MFLLIIQYFDQYILWPSSAVICISVKKKDLVLVSFFGNEKQK